MNKRIDFSNLGGFPLDQDNLDFMQSSYRDCFAALAKLFGEKTIIEGVVVTGGSVSSGWIVYQGELVRFVGGPLTANVAVSTGVTAALFDDNVQRDIEFVKTATCVSVGGFPFSDLKTLPTFITTVLALSALTTAFNNHVHNWADIQNKPNDYISHSGTFAVGNPALDQIYTIAIPNQGDNNYKVIGTMVSLSANHAIDNDVSWVVREFANNNFKLSVREYENVGQNLRFDYIIIKTLP